MGSNSSSSASLVFMIVIIALAVVIGLWVGINRYRRIRTTGTTEDPVRSRKHARELADRMHSFSSSSDPSTNRGGSGHARVEVHGAAELLDELSKDDRFRVDTRDDGDEYWSFTVGSASDSSGREEDEKVGRGLVDILERNGVTASAAGDRR